ncbi:MAG TPA: gamma carbonic anhydrase family protein [Candidatus Binatia bacterium]|nr:gamma carbonic anhydrase family protein [Candidatus Binatia bacterium]
MIYELEGRAPKFLGPDWFIADNAAVIGAVTMHQNSSIWFGCTVRGDTDDIVIGENTNIQDGSVLHTDPGIQLRIGRDVTVGHMVMLHGCEIGDATLIGIKSVILNGAKIGKNCIIGANTLVTEGKQIPDGSMVMGSPGKIVRPVTPQEIQMIPHLAAHYVENAKRYRQKLKSLNSA